MDDEGTEISTSADPAGIKLLLAMLYRAFPMLFTLMTDDEPGIVVDVLIRTYTVEVEGAVVMV